MEDFGLGWAMVGIVLTALVTSVGTWYVTRYQLEHQAKATRHIRLDEIERDGRYIAVRVVCILDPFVLECCDVVGDEGVWDQEGIRHTKISSPKLIFPENVDWRSMKPHLMYRALTLPNELENADRSILAVDEYVASAPDYEEVFEERQYQFAKLGLAAMDLARDLRRAYGLDQPDYSRWNPRTTLERAFADEDQQRRLNAEMTQKLIDRHEARQQAALAGQTPPDMQPIEDASNPHT